MHEVYEALVLGTRDYVRKNGFTNVVIGLSGGIDSALVAAIAVDALGAEHVAGVLMPSRYSSDHSISDAEALAANLGIESFTVPIEPAHAAFEAMLGSMFEGTDAGLAEENVQARVRGNVLMTISNKFGWMVLTTGNKSEMATGYATLYGDMAGGFAVIKDVPKTLVYALCNDLNERAGRDLIPRTVIEKPPSAELAPGSARLGLVAAVRRARSDRRGLRRGRPVGERADRARTRRRSHAPRRANGRSQRVQAPAGRTGCARVAEGVRQGSPTPDHQSLARLSVEPDGVSGSVPLTWETARPLVPEMALIAATIAYGATFKLVQDALDRRDAGRIHPAAFRDGRDRVAAVRAPQRLAWAVDRAAHRCDRATSRSRCSRSAWSGSSGYWFQNEGLERTTTSNSAFITGLFVVFTPLLETAVTRRRPSLNVLIAVGFAVVGLFLLEGSTLRLQTGDALTLAGAFFFGLWILIGSYFTQHFDPIALTAGQLVVFVVLAIPVVAIGGLGHVTTQVLIAAAITGVCCSALAFSLQLWGLRFVEPSRAAVILDLRTGRGRDHRVLDRRASGRVGLRRRGDHHARHRHCRVACVVGGPAGRRPPRLNQASRRT